MILSCLCVFWISRIISINQNNPTTIYYDIGDVVDCGDLELYFVESHLDSVDDFNRRFETNLSDTNEYKVISLCVEVTNKSSQSVSWNKIVDFLECGFESSVWGSSLNPSLCSKINVFNSDCLLKNESHKIWFVTEVNKVCFRDDSWDRIYEYQYEYVLSLSNPKTTVRLDVWE